MKRLVRVVVMDVMSVWICGGYRVRSGGAAFSLLVSLLVVSCSGVEMGWEASIGGMGKVKSFCTIWAVSMAASTKERGLYLLQTGDQSCEQAGPLFAVFC